MTHDQFQELKAMVQQTNRISTDDNPDAQFFAWWQCVLKISILNTTGENFEAFKAVFFDQDSKLQPPTTIDPDAGPDEAFFAWMETNKIALLDLDADGFEQTKQGYCLAAGIDPADASYNPATDTESAAKASAGRFDDAIAAEILGVDEIELAMIADFTGVRGNLSEVLADDDGMIGIDDLRYLAAKKAMRDKAISSGELDGWPSH